MSRLSLRAEPPFHIDFAWVEPFVMLTPLLAWEPGESVRREMVMEVALWGGVQREEGSGLLARRSLQLGSSRLYH